MWFWVISLSAALVGLFFAGTPGLDAKAWKDPCRGYCGEGTQCVAGSCQMLVRAQAPQTKPKKARQRKKRRARRAAMKNPALPWANDRKVPRFDANAIQKINANDESGRLDQMDIDAVLAKLQPAWERCVERADSRAQGELPEGRVHLSFGVNGHGKVTGVNAKAPKGLKKYGIIPCVRLAIFSASFPAYRGPDTRVESHFDVAF